MKEEEEKKLKGRGESGGGVVLMGCVIQYAGEIDSEIARRVSVWPLETRRPNNS